MEKIADPELMRDLQELSINLDILSPMRDLRNQYPFRGDEELDLLEAMRLMDRLQGLDELEKQLERTQYGGALDDIDEEKLRELLGEEAAETFRQLKQFLEVLEQAGYIRRKGGNWELTPRGVRKIGQKALGEIYAQLKKSDYGKHALRERGSGGERVDETKKYEFGDPFHLNLGETIMNAVFREGPDVPVRLDKDDFQVFSSEQVTQTATVMMLDLSWSMALRGSFQAAKKVALALNNLIRTPVPQGQPLHPGLLGLRPRAHRRAAPLRALGRIGAGHQHAPRLHAGPAAPVQAQGGHAPGDHDLRRRAHGPPGARALLLRLPAQPHHHPRDPAERCGAAPRRASSSTPSCWTATTTSRSSSTRSPR